MKQNVLILKQLILIIKMKRQHKSFIYRIVAVILISFLLFLVNSCLEPYGAGTLGSSANKTTDCSEQEILEYMDEITQDSIFRIPSYLQKKSKWWEDAGYDFLTYWTYKDGDKLYCISYNTQENSLSIRGLYKIKSKSDKWTFATDFSKKDHENTMRSIEKLLIGLYCVR
jgi:hypothetical protein